MLDSLVDVVERWSALRGERLAFAELDVRAELRACMSYRVLAERARAVAGALAGGAPPGERALLLFPPGIDFVAGFFGCLYAGVLAVPVYPPRSVEDAPRLAGIVAGARPAVVVSTRAFLARIEPMLARIDGLAGVPRLAIDDLAAHAWTLPRLGPGSLAFLQYTSGSTGRPRGVMVSHGNLMANERVIQERTGHHPDRTVFAGWLPLYHDMGLIGNVLQSAYLGIPCYLMSPLDFVKRPLVWLEAITRYRVTTSGGPSFAYDHCVRRIPDDAIGALDLSSWDVAFNGAEPVRADVLERFAARAARAGFRREAFYPCYGLAESTLMVTGGDRLCAPHVIGVDRGALGAGRVVRAAHGDAQLLVGCGRPADDHRAIVVDAERWLPAEPGCVGEIWVQGPSVCAGYWDDAAATAETFGATLSGEPARFLRTGDLGFVADAQLFVVGRSKELIIVRGCNHYPEDIERTIERAHPALRAGCGVVFGVDVAGEERVVAVHEVARGIGGAGGAGVAEIAAGVTEAVAMRHGLRLHASLLVKPGTIPKTSSGKLRRTATRSLYIEGKLQGLDA
ncbi:MAG TPA: fatty acyl-AMP ligase [Kofleriaceae bacterium]|nr:fatty acyl-AMP ligase [Kofleriaceae bacterium]